MARLSFDVDQELLERANIVLRWGSKSRVMRNLLEQLVERVEREGSGPLAEILSWRPGDHVKRTRK